MGFLLGLFFLVWMVGAEPATISLTFPNGTVIQVDLAQTPRERALGLMDRSSLPPDHGMLFVFEKDDLQFFWMKNTLLPLDMIWLDSRKRILYIKENAPPCKKDPCPTYGPSRKSRYVLEVNAGMAQKQGLKIGMALKF